MSSQPFIFTFSWLGLACRKFCGPGRAMNVGLGLQYQKTHLEKE